MITNLGKNIVRSYIAGLTPAIGQSIAVGISSNAPALTDTEMGFEVVRVPVTSVSLDPVTNKVVFKGTMENASSVRVHEIGLWNSEGVDDSTLVLAFDDFDEAWEGPVTFTEASTVSRIGTSLMNISISGTTSQVASYPVEATDLTKMLGPDDRWSISLNKTGTASVTVKLKLTSATGTLELNFFPSNVSTAGYLFGTSLVKAAVTTGTFDPSAVERFDISVIPAAGNATTATVQLDGVVATNATYERNGSVLVARSVVVPAFVTNSATSTDLEYELEVTV